MPEPFLTPPLAALGSTLGVVVVILGIGFLIFVHELGHFLVAKWNKVRVEAFSLGFGPVLWGFRRGDTHYRLSAIPLGGYVKMAGELPTDRRTDDPGAFANKSIPSRIAVICAGVAMNAFTGILFFVIAFNIGVPLPPPVVGGTESGSPAWLAGLRPGDRVLSVNGTRLMDFEDLMSEVAFTRGKVTLVIERDGERITLRGIEPRIDPLHGIRRLGIRSAAERKIQVEEDSPAARAGLRTGDELLRVAGVDAADQVALERALWRARGPVAFVIRREGEWRTITVAPVRKPAPDARAIIGISRLLATVDAVRPGSPAAEAGFTPGDRILAVNGKTVVSLPQALEAAKGTRPGPVVFTVRRGDRRVDLGPVKGVERPEDWDRFFDDLAAGYDEERKTAVGVLPDHLFATACPARAAGLAEGAVVHAVGGKPVADFLAIRDAISAVPPDRPVSVTFTNPGGERRTVEIRRQPQLRNDFGLTLTPATETVRVSGLFRACAAGVRRSILKARQILDMLGSMISGRVSAKNLGGPVAIFQISYASARRNFIHFLYFLGILSINLAILNILPIPILDGGHLLFLIVEALKGKPVSERTMAVFQWAGLLLLLLLMVFVVTNDVIRLF